MPSPPDPKIKLASLYKFTPIFILVLKSPSRAFDLPAVFNSWKSTALVFVKKLHLRFLAFSNPMFEIFITYIKLL